MRGLLLLAVLAAALPAFAASGDFWARPRHGANWFNLEPRARWLQDAREAGLQVVRLTPSKWRGEGPDFLLGSADRYEGLPPGDLRRLVDTLDEAEEAGVPIVVVPLSLPGARWRQHNGEKLDPRLWQDERFMDQAAAFWRDLAEALRDHPAVVGYDLLNEPVPERAKASGRLNVFNRRMLAAIREVDPSTPVIVESGLWASPERFAALEPLDDAEVLYSFHLYEPEEFTDWRNNHGQRPYRDGEVEEYLRPVVEWQARHGVPDNRIFAAEFGCHRRLPGAERYLADAAAALTRHGWHWAFYSFREDEWDGMNYELGPGPLSETERVRLAEGAAPPATRRPNPLWEALVPYLAR